MSDFSSLLDQYGKKIPSATIAQLREEIAPIGGQYARPPFTGHLAFGIDPQRLGAIVKAADNGSTQEWMIVAEEIEELFPHYYAVLSKRKRQVAQLPITVEDADESAEAKKHGDFIRDWLKTQTLQHALYNVLDAVGKGYSVHEIEWETEPGRIRPKCFHYLPQRFFEISWQDGETIWLRSEKGFEDLLPHKFLLHRHPSKSGMVTRGGLTRAVAFLWMWSSYTLKDWALFVQGYGLPIRLGRYGPEASESDKRTLWRAVSSIAGDVAAMIPKSMEMEFVNAGEHAGGTELYLKRANWLDQQVSKLVLGSTTGTDAISGGHAVGKEHRQVEEDVERFDAFLLKISIDRQIIPAMIAFTFGPQKAYPTVTIGRPDLVPLNDLISGIADLGAMGLKVKASQIRERLQLEDPAEGDEIVGGAPEPEPAPEIPRPVKVPPIDLNARRWLGGLSLLSSEAEPEITDRLTARLAEDAAGAMHGLTDAVRRVFDQATDMRDLSRRLSRLNLKPDDLAEAMARGMALANLVGQAAVVEEMHDRTRVARMARGTASNPNDGAD